MSLKLFLGTLLCGGLLFTAPYNNAIAQNFGPMPHAPKVEPTTALIDQAVISEIRSFIETEIVRISVANQNVKYGNIAEDRIIELDKQWRGETKSDDKPLISSTLSNPLSSYLTRIQAHSGGLYSEIFVMDQNGLNVGQSNISSDYWQGDESKFQKTYPTGPKAVFIDEPEYNEGKGLWFVQVNMSVADEQGKTIGAVTTELNLSELARRSTLKS